MATNRTRTPIRHVNGQPTVRYRISLQPSTASYGLTRDEAAEAMRELAPRVWVPREFGRATWLDREEIQDAPKRRIGPQKLRLWRLLGIAVALLLAAIVNLILLAIHDVVVWSAERIRSIVKGLA